MRAAINDLLFGPTRGFLTPRAETTQKCQKFSKKLEKNVKNWYKLPCLCLE